MKPQPHFLPMSMREAQKLGIEEFDIILVTGDANWERAKGKLEKKSS